MHRRHVYMIELHLQNFAVLHALEAQCNVLFVEKAFINPL